MLILGILAAVYLYVGLLVLLVLGPLTNSWRERALIPFLWLPAYLIGPVRRWVQKDPEEHW